MWNVNVTVENKTNYTIGIVNNYMPHVEVAAGQSYTWNTDMTNNANALNLFQGADAPPYLTQGNLSFGPEAGVYVDRGWMQDQTLKMTANANGKVWTQTQNGGETLLAWNEFEQGGDITITYEEA